MVLLKSLQSRNWWSIICYSPHNEQGKILRKNFVFKIVPMLNPDGVARGYYRLDTNAYNLNRFYLTPNRVSNQMNIHLYSLITQQYGLLKKQFSITLIKWKTSISTLTFMLMLQRKAHLCLAIIFQVSQQINIQIQNKSKIFFCQD
jgi:hypothetical protein